MSRNDYIFHMVRSGLLIGEGMIKGPDDDVSDQIFEDAFGPIMEDIFIKVLKDEGIDKFIKDKDLAKEFFNNK